MELSMAEFARRQRGDQIRSRRCPEAAIGFTYGGFCPKAARGLNLLALARESCQFVQRLPWV